MSGIQETGSVRNRVVFSQCWYFFLRPELNFDSSKMIYIIYTIK